MRGLRSLLILVAVLAGLVAYIYFVESKRPETSGGEPPKAKAFTVTADKIEELRVKASSGDRTTLKKGSDGWTVTEPAALKADESEVSSITSNLASLEIQRTVDDKATDLKQYGLAEPKVEITFKAEGDKADQTLMLGDKTATGGDLYAKYGSQPKVFLISAYLESTFNKTTFDLRDKAVLTFDRNKADAIEITAANRTLRFAKSGEDWRLTAPVEAKADYGSVEGLLGRVQTAQMKAIAAPEVTDPKQYGFDKPEVTVAIGAGSSRATLVVGKAGEAGTFYARDQARPMVFTIESSLVDELKKTSDDYRRKDLFEFRSFTANRIDITRGKDTLAFEKTKGEGKDAQEKWRQVLPAPKDVDATKLDSFLTRLSGLRAQSFLDPADKTTKTGLNAPAATVVVKFDEGKKQERVVFGKVENDVFASCSGEAGVAKLTAFDYDDVMKLLDDIK
jgi:hypothetical protein